MQNFLSPYQTDFSKSSSFPPWKKDGLSDGSKPTENLSAVTNDSQEPSENIHTAKTRLYLWLESNFRFFLSPMLGIMGNIWDKTTSKCTYMSGLCSCDLCRGCGGALSPFCGRGKPYKVFLKAKVPQIWLK